MGEFKTNAKTREYARKYMREYRKAHPEVVEKNREHSRLFRVRNPTYHHEYYLEDKEKWLSYRRDYYRANGDGVPHRGIWARHFKVKIPEGFIIHHKDLDPSNNEPHNLLCLSRQEHIRLHWMKKNE
jgi:hypothetical protein